MVSKSLVAAASVFATTASAYKRGLCFNDGFDLSGFGPNFFAKGEITWTYNWDSSTSNNNNYGEFVPMLWGPGSDHTSQWNNNANDWLGRGSSHLLGFNEPDRPDQANLSTSAAVNAWHQYMEPFAGRARLGAPAVSNGGYGWLQDFLNQCQGCNIDFVPVHWYNGASQEGDFENWVNSICSLVGNRKVWITEFKGWGSQGEQMGFLKKAMPFLDNNPCVDRYAYFGVNYGNSDLVVGHGPDITDLGAWYGFDLPIDRMPDH